MVRHRNTNVAVLGNVDQEFSIWLQENYKRFENLKDAVISIATNLLAAGNVDILAVTGRTKNFESAVEKVNRKGYIEPKSQMTDIAGIRIIVYLESDVKRVAEIIRKSFSVDEINSSNSDDKMSTNQVGYRSMHFVCELGDIRTNLPEFATLKGLKFEFQVRTVLQHAWAELSHDRNYKFSGQLPRPLERRLFLLAGLLETADQGLDDLSKSVDEYIDNVNKDSESGDLNIELNSITLVQFVEKWASENSILLKKREGSSSISTTVVRELSQYGVATLADLKGIIPEGFAEKGISTDNVPTIYGIVRRWMVIHDPDRFVEKVEFSWTMGVAMIKAVKNYFSEDKAKEIIKNMLEKRKPLGFVATQ